MDGKRSSCLGAPFDGLVQLPWQRVDSYCVVGSYDLEIV